MPEVVAARKLQSVAVGRRDEQAVLGQRLDRFRQTADYLGDDFRRRTGHNPASGLRGALNTEACRSSLRTAATPGHAGIWASSKVTSASCQAARSAYRFWYLAWSQFWNAV